MLFTSEQVLEGHPDKLADQISDGILDEFLKQDNNSRVACEVLVTTGQVHIAGEVTSSAYVDIPKVVREVLLEAGYNDAEYGIDGRNCGISVSLDEQSSDIAQGVDVGGAGDQGMMFGYATNETPEYMPMPIMIANKLCRKLAEVRKTHLLNYLRPDGKAQITVEYDDNGKPKRVDTIVVSVQHEPYIPYGLMKMDIYDQVITKVIPEKMLDENTKIYINPTGRFVVGGPQGDCGLTGRKIICDTYGGMARHGGGAFSGKEPTKVDRSGAYMARYIAKNVVGAGFADKCEVQIAYAIGKAEPVSVMVETFGTEKIDKKEIERKIDKVFDMTPKGIIETLDLRRPIYRKTATYGHFGREEFSWEKLDKVEALKNA